MTNIIVYHQPKEISVMIQGHSGYAERGKDIVCAGISALTFTLEEALNKNRIKHQFAKDENKAQIVITISHTEYAKIHKILSAILDGYRLLAEAYPEYAKITVR